MCHNVTQHNIDFPTRYLWLSQSVACNREPRAKLAPSRGLEGLNYIFHINQQHSGKHDYVPLIHLSFVLLSLESETRQAS